MSYTVGSLVRARGREWVVLPESTDELLILRPLGGSDVEIAGIHTALEPVEPATFDLPDPTHVGDHRSCRLLRDALRLGFRSTAGPFRSFGRIAVEPRPYQLVPLLMGLRLDPVRLLIADDVGIGKTVEALLIARELIDRGECQRLTVLCPPHLAEQWQNEMRKKFHIDAELVLPGTARRLERQLTVDQSLFDIYPYTVVSLDYIKADRRRDEFIRTCPELVIVDEAHTCAFDANAPRGRHQRFDLVRKLSEDQNRHLILVTATPHSGKEEAFRSLLSFLKPEFRDLPPDLTGKENEPIRRELARYFVQRRRADIEHFLDEDTHFPKREEAEDHYSLTPEYKRLFNKALDYAREIVRDESGGRHQQRVRWWSALALLRALASSPAAAAATLRNRSPVAETETPEQADEVGRGQILDQADPELLGNADVTPGADPSPVEDTDSKRRRLLALAREADQLRGDSDAKLIKAVALINKLLNDGFSPIVFCRFIDTAEYLGEELRKRLSSKVTVGIVTGKLPPEEREQRVLELGEKSPRVLVCTDCLSEGINLQQDFDAVMHYDLSWNPTRHEQREGRVDRFGQKRKIVRTLTYYGIDNQIDGIVLDVLLRKHKKIRNSLGISVPVPADTNAVVEAIFEGLLLRERAGSHQDLLPGLDEYLQGDLKKIHAEWDRAGDREKRSRTMFSHEGIQARVDEVAKELNAARAAVGSHTDVTRFTAEAVSASGGIILPRRHEFELDLSDAPLALRDVLGVHDKPKLNVAFDLPTSGDTVYLSRTHPIVEGLASYVLTSALDDSEDAIARRCGAIRTDAVGRRTTLLLLRYRFHLRVIQGSTERELLAEDSEIIGFRGSPQNAEWISTQEVEALLSASPCENIPGELRSAFVRRVIDGYDAIKEQLNARARARGNTLLDAHRRVRTAARWKGVRYSVHPELPPDVLGIYVYLPPTGKGVNGAD